MIHFTNVSKIYENQTALRNITFSIEKGEMAFITGRAAPENQPFLRLSIFLKNLMRAA